eukprot:386638_1
MSLKTLSFNKLLWMLSITLVIIICAMSGIFICKNNTLLLSIMKDPSDNMQENKTNIHTETYTQIDIRYNRLQSIRRNHMNLTRYQCVYFEETGLPKSGTSWLLNILLQISEFIAQHNLDTFKRFKVAANQRHKLKSIEDEMHQLQNITHAFDDGKICKFIVFRDPRDRYLSWAHFNQKRPNIFGNHNYSEVELEQDLLNRMHSLFKNSKRSDLTNIWWSFYTELEEKYLDQYFIYFFQDLVYNPKKILEDMIYFSGYLDYFNQTDIDKLTEQISFKNMEMNSRKKRKGKHCVFKDELNENDIILANQWMLTNVRSDLL